jgi:rod shape-determining protein MreD
MKTPFGKGILVILTVYLAAALTQVVGTMSHSVFVPDFMLIATCCLGFFVSKKGCIITGASCGIIQGAIVGANLTWYGLTRLLAGWIMTLFRSLDLESNALAAALITTIVSFVSQLAFLFVAPSAALGVALLATMGTALVNGVLAAPLFALLKRLLDPVSR